MLEVKFSEAFTPNIWKYSQAFILQMEIFQMPKKKSLIKNYDNLYKNILALFFMKLSSKLSNPYSFLIVFNYQIIAHNIMNSCYFSNYSIIKYIVSLLNI